MTRKPKTPDPDYKGYKRGRPGGRYSTAQTSRLGQDAVADIAAKIMRWKDE